MKVYDKSIKKTFDILNGLDPIIYAFDPSSSWQRIDSSELILNKDVAVELGPSHLKGVAYTMVTSNPCLIKENKTKVIGDDIKNLKDNSVSFGKIVIVKVKELDEEVSYAKIKDLERLRFRVHLEGYMLRASTQQKRETIRINNAAVKQGLTFEKIGNSLIGEYLKNDLVENVEIIFLTGMDKTIEDLTTIASKVKEITDAMNHIFDNIEFDCHSCNFSEICDEIDGMKEMHGKINTSSGRLSPRNGRLTPPPLKQQTAWPG